LNNDDRTIIGDPNPDFIWGWNNDFRWKGFDMNIFFQASQGNDIFNYTLMELDLMAGRNNATTAALTDGLLPTQILIFQKLMEVEVEEPLPGGFRTEVSLD
jgi:hypothetical protein